MVLVEHSGRHRCSGKWARRNDRFLDLVYMRFEESGQWPRVDDLQRDLLRLRDDLDVFACAEQLPSALGGMSDDNRVFLTVSGLAYLDAARDFLNDFLAVIQLAVGRYRDGERGTTPRLCENDLLGQLSLGDRRANRVMKVLGAGCPLFTENELDHSFAITSDIRHFVSVRSVRDYVTILNRLERRRQRKAFRTRGGIRAWLARRQIAIWEWIVITVVAGLILAACISGIASLASSLNHQPHAIPANRANPNGATPNR
jgi:hypothetical protein